MLKINRLTKVIQMLVGASLIFSLAGPVAAGEGGDGFTAEPLAPESTFETSKPDVGALPEVGIASLRTMTPSAPTGGDMVSVFVKLSDDSLATYDGGIQGLPATSPEATGAERLDVDAPASQLYLSYLAEQQDSFEANATKAVSGAVVTHRFDVILGGVSMLVPPDQIEQIANLPGVEAVYPDSLEQIDTERTPQFIGAPAVWNVLGGQESAGEGVIVGVLDTGIWPEHPSFSDPDPSGKPYAPPPASWTGTTCDFGSAIPGDAPFTCNNKLIGAYRFMDTYDFFGPPLLPGEFLSARDDNGHGTHTASTAAGNAGVEASIFGVPRGTISGIAPRAHVVMYKVCGDAGCFSSDSAAAVQQAILDGVNVINFSISGGNNPYSDVVELAFLDAYEAGIFVAASAGNSGPTPDTTSHRGPWVTTVAASTADRAFKNTVTLFGNGGATLSISGTSLTGGVTTPAEVVVPADTICANPFAPGSVAGKIVICKRGTVGRVQKGYNVLQGGAVGMILYNNAANVTDLETDNHFLPTTHIQFSEGEQILAFLAANPGATATLTAGVTSTQQGDVMASFSSRGGTGQTLGVSKPDVTAPGVQILAGHTPMSVELATGPAGELFQAIAGTSMSSPHVAGAAALIKAVHPNWTAGQIKSALMTTALTANVYKEDGVTPADAFDFGSGRINLRKAWDPYLTFDATAMDYVLHANDLWNVNYPSVFVPRMPGVITVQRTALDVRGCNNCEWDLKVKSPTDLRITVPKHIRVPRNSTATFDITIDARNVPVGETRFATITLRRGDVTLHIPVTILRREPVVMLTQTCTPSVFPQGSTSNCTVAMQNTTFSPANVNFFERVETKAVKLVGGSVTGASANGHNVTFSGVLAGAEPPNVTIADGGLCASPACGYLSLADLGAPPNVALGDETIVNFALATPFVYAGESYTTIGMTSNGYAVVGGGTAADVQFINQSLPNASRPNNVLAPFWTDLDGSAGGTYYAYTLTSGSLRWTVLEWKDAPEWGSGLTNSFQIWIGRNGVEDITFVYGTLNGDGDGHFLTVGAENRFGNRGANYYVDGVGTLPTSTTELVVSGVPGVPGETHTITFAIEGEKKGLWTLYGELTSDLFQGINIERVAGEVTKK